jgi:hypothetical protein
MKSLQREQIVVHRAWRTLATIQSAPAQAGAFALSVFAEIGWAIRTYLRIDRYIGIIIIVFLALYGPPITRDSDNPSVLAAFFDDEVWQALALDGMLEEPYGNPANFLDLTAPAYKKIPPEWGYFRYPGITYYGGAMYQLAAPAYAGLRAIGAPTFPTVVIVLRILTTLAGLLSLIVLYNLGCRFATRPAAIMAVLFLMADPYFTAFTLMIHPDLLQVLFGLFALALAIRHSKRGDLPSLAALGIACGFVQGAKMGGPWTVPMAALAAWWGLQSAGLRLTLGRGIVAIVVLGAASLVGLFVTTPYAFIGHYYLDQVRATWQLQGTTAEEGPFGVITIWSWTKELYAYMGPLGAVLCGLAVGRILLSLKTAQPNRPFALALVLCISQLMVYGSGKYWVMIYYLLLAFALMALLAFDTLATLTRFAATVATASEPRQRQTLALKLAATGLFVVFAVSYTPYGLLAPIRVLDADLHGSSTPAFLNRWAVNNVPPDMTIMFDNYAYFDPAVFTHVIRIPHPNWRNIAGSNPDYLVLSGGIYTSPYFSSLISTQSLDEDDTYQYSVRVYQDLLQATEFGPAGKQGIDYVTRIASVPLVQGRQLWPWVGQLPLPSWIIGKLAAVDFELRELAAQVDALLHPPAQPITGYEFRVYRLNPPGAPNGRPVPFASSEAPGHGARHAFDGGNDFWEASAVGDATEQYIGYDFGDRDARAVRQVRIEWVDAETVPPAIRVESSDDGTRWASAGGFAVTPIHPASPHRIDTFPLTSSDAHRFWRVVGVRNGAEGRFAMAKLYFSSDIKTKP